MKLLYNVFIMKSPQEQTHYQVITRVLLWILVLNWGVAFIKIIYGFISKCSSITADGFHSLSDGASNIIGIIGIHYASTPGDADHPYGHKKYETLASLGIAALLFFISLNLVKEGITRLIHPVTPTVDLRSFAIMIITLVVNLGVVRYEYKKGKALKSDILVSDSMHTKADIFVSLSVIITLVAIKAGWPILDPISTIAIAGFIAYSGFKITKMSADVLCDTAAILDIQKVKDIVLSVKHVQACHKIRTRGRADDVHIDLHAQVSRSMHIDDAHKVCYAIEEALKAGIPEVTDVVVHIEPK